MSRVACRASRVAVHGMLSGQFQQQGDLDDAQRQAVDKLLKERIGVLSGAGGTGKTRILKTMVQQCLAQNIECYLLAPTADATDLMLQSVGACEGVKSMTIDYALATPKDLKRMRYGCAVFVDEASMASRKHLSGLLDALWSKDRLKLLVRMLIFIGDPYQLEPVSHGSFFRELIATRYVSTVTLTRVYRQSGDSNLLKALQALRDRCNVGFRELSAFTNDNTFMLHEIPASRKWGAEGLDEEKNAVVQAVMQYVSAQTTYDSNIQVMCMSRKIRDVLNDKLRQHFNPQGMYVMINGVAVNDPIINRKNYKDPVTKQRIVNNGTRGWLRITPSGRFFAEYGAAGDPGYFCDYYDPNKPRNGFNTKFEARYCITVHASQGKEFDVAICAMDGAFRKPKRSMLYTAVSRAKQGCVLISSDRLLRRMTSEPLELDPEMMNEFSCFDRVAFERSRACANEKADALELVQQEKAAARRAKREAARAEKIARRVAAGNAGNVTDSAPGVDADTETDVDVDVDATDTDTGTGTGTDTDSDTSCSETISETDGETSSYDVEDGYIQNTL